MERDITDARYLLEHRILPKYFFKEKESFIVTLVRSEKNIPFELIQKICEEEEIELPYTPEDFDMVPFNVTNSIKGLCLDFPEPERSPLCWRIYLLFDMDLKKYGYYTVEKGEDDSDFVCGWQEEEESLSHVNYGFCPEELEEEMNGIIGTFLEQYSDEERPEFEEDEDE